MCNEMLLKICSEMFKFIYLPKMCNNLQKWWILKVQMKIQLL